MRKVGIAMAVLVACSATAFVAFLFDYPSSGWSSKNSWGTPAAIAAAVLAWVGVWGWTQRRYWVAAGGAWAAIWGSFWLWSLVLVPIAFALVTTLVAIVNAFRKPPDARDLRRRLAERIRSGRGIDRGQDILDASRRW